MLNLRLPARAVGIAASTACASASRSVSVFNICIAVTGTRLETVRVIFDKVADVVVLIGVGLPDVTPVAVLLIQIPVCTESRC